MKTNQIKKQKKQEEDNVRYGVLFLRRIPRQLKASYKAHCAKRNKSMRSNIVGHMEECVKKDAV